MFVNSLKKCTIVRRDASAYKQVNNLARRRPQHAGESWKSHDYRGDKFLLFEQRFRKGQISYIDTILMWQIKSYRTKRQIYQHIQHNINLTL